MEKSKTSKLLLITTLLAALLLFGCLDQTYRPAAYRGNATITAAQPPAPATQTNQPVGTQPAAQVTTNPAATRPTTSQNRTQTAAPNPYQQPPEQVPGVQYFTIEADDAGIYPSTLNLHRGLVELTFKVRSQGVYYGGLEFRSDVVNIPKILPGRNLTYVFTANRSFTFTTYWPASNTRKADAQVIVNG